MDQIERQTIAVPNAGLAPIVGQWPCAALLESGPGFGGSGRTSVYAAWPRLVFEATSASWRIKPDVGPTETGHGDPLGRLARLLACFGLARPGDTPDEDTPGFSGGLIGYLGYDLAPRLERLPRKAARESRMSDIRFGLYDTAVVVDHASGAAEIRAVDLLGEGPSSVSRRVNQWQAAPRDAPACRCRLAPPAAEQL